MPEPGVLQGPGRDSRQSWPPCVHRAGGPPWEGSGSHLSPWHLELLLLCCVCHTWGGGLPVLCRPGLQHSGGGQSVKGPPPAHPSVEGALPTQLCAQATPVHLEDSVAGR